jgi:hypothetical protein
LVQDVHSESDFECHFNVSACGGPNQGGSYIRLKFNGTEFGRGVSNICSWYKMFMVSLISSVISMCSHVGGQIWVGPTLGKILMVLDLGKGSSTID